jgi:AraC-like DNA-binding protein
MAAVLPTSTPKRPDESDVWESVSGAWRPLFGSYFERGISIEWHDFQIASDMDWAPSFHPGSLEICLNFSGSAWLRAGEEERELTAGSFALYSAEPRQLQARRMAGSIHRFITLELSRAFLGEQCAEDVESLRPSIQRFLAGEKGVAPVLESEPLSTHLLSMRGPLLAPPVPDGARDTWYLAKAMEVLAHTVFQPSGPASELFCHRHQRQNRERVERVCYLIQRDIENPPSLEMLANEVACSTFHLSRIFAELTEMSIPKYLRMKRIERAAELLKSKKANVTEAAMAVGYASLSAFNKAFVEQMGCCPGLYPVVPIAGRNEVRRKAGTRRS